MAKNKNTYITFNTNERTPKGLYKVLNAEFNFDYDPCPLNLNPKINGLEINWGRRCYVNPPYGKTIKAWLEKALFEINAGRADLVVFLLPANTDVKWFHEIVLPKAKEIRFIRGRLKFGEHSNCAPFASMILVFN